MRGSILQYDDNAGSGLISGDDGVRYSFQRADLKQLRPVSSGMKVDFVQNNGVATEIYIVDASGGIAPQPGAAAPAPAAAYTGEDLGLWGYFKKVMGKSFDGHGRARRKEYWSFALFTFLIMSLVYVPLIFTAVGAISSAAMSDSYGYEMDPSALFGALGVWVYLVLVVAIVFTPAGITVMIRRLHDIGLSGWLVLVGLVPYLGGIFLFVCALIPSQAAVNKHGAIPKPQPSGQGG